MHVRQIALLSSLTTAEGKLFFFKQSISTIFHSSSPTTYCYLWFKYLLWQTLVKDLTAHY